jgi:hypothetical protein
MFWEFKNEFGLLPQGWYQQDCVFSGDHLKAVILQVSGAQLVFVRERFKPIHSSIR